MTKKKERQKREGKGFRVFIYVFFLKGGGGQGGKEKDFLRDTKRLPIRSFKDL